MAGSASKVTLILLIALAITIPCLEAGIAEFDDFLKAQADMAREIAFKSYIPDPENTNSKLHAGVHMALDEASLNNTGKELKQKFSVHRKQKQNISS